MSTQKLKSTLSRRDLDHIMEHSGSIWDKFRGETVFITGGTGYFGSWLLEAFILANDQLGLNAQAVVMSRNPAVFANKCPHIAQHQAVKIMAGDVLLHNAFPDISARYVIHAATDASARLNAKNPLLMFETIVTGTRNTLEYARKHGVETVLFTSSGAVYGSQPPGIEKMPEDIISAPDQMNPEAAYGQGKYAAEAMCRLYAIKYGFEAKIIRAYAQVGPYLPLDIHFAMGNFLQDAMCGRPIFISGDGTPVRSYLYGADLAIWLWTILARGISCRPYNLGSDEAVSILQLATIINNRLNPDGEVIIAEKSTSPEIRQRYVPEISRARRELGLEPWIKLEESIERTSDWLHSQGQGAAVL